MNERDDEWQARLEAMKRGPGSRVTMVSYSGRGARLAYARARLGDAWPADALARAERHRELRAEAMAEAHAAGLTWTEVADALGMHVSGVEQFVRRWGRG